VEHLEQGAKEIIRRGKDDPKKIKMYNLINKKQIKKTSI
jgi:hypothetical protein